MKRNVNVFIAVVLVAVLCGGIIWLQTANDEKLGWNIHDTYGEAPAYSNNGAAYTNATFAGPSANEGGVMTLSPSRTMRHSAASSCAGAYAISYGVGSAPLTSNLSPLTSAPTGGGLYTTSSQSFHSYGGGGNGGAAIGGAMRGSSSPNSLIASSPITSISSPIAYSIARRSDMTVAAGENLAQMAAENPVMAMTNAANAGMSNGFYGGYTAMDYSGSANYGQYTGMFGGGSRMGVRGRQNTGEDMESTYANWLRWFDQVGWSYGTASGNNYSYDSTQAQNAYNAWVASLSDFMPVPSYEEWLSWFMGNGGTHTSESSGNTYSFVPVGGILPLLLIALLYVLFVAVKSKSLKSLMKTERSE